MPKSLSLFLAEMGPTDTDICHFVSPGPVPTLSQTFQSEFTALCNPPCSFPPPPTPQKSSKPKSFNNGLCSSLSTVQSLHSWVTTRERLQQASLAPSTNSSPICPYPDRGYSAHFARSLRVFLSFMQAPSPGRREGSSVLYPGPLA